MKLEFYRYQGTGNDFIMVDARQQGFDRIPSPSVQRFCDRKLGIGADGLILIKEKSGFDFEMIYYNADGSQSMCGNGAGCAVAFSSFLGFLPNPCRFYVIDGPHEAKYRQGQVEVEMTPVRGIVQAADGYLVDTGSPHYVKFVEDVENHSVIEEGATIRYNECYRGGINVNFVTAISEDEIFVRTYERGVENETLSCGTGVTASALVWGRLKNKNQVKIKTPGGSLVVGFTSRSEGGFDHILLTGAVKQVFKGEIEGENFRFVQSEPLLTGGVRQNSGKSL